MPKPQNYINNENNLKNAPKIPAKIINKSLKNQCKIVSSKSIENDAQKLENGNQKGSPNQLKTNKNMIEKMIEKRIDENPDPPRHPPVTHRAAGIWQLGSGSQDLVARLW